MLFRKRGIGKNSSTRFLNFYSFLWLAIFLVWFSSCSSTSYTEVPLECKPGGQAEENPPSWSDSFPIRIGDGKFNPGFTTHGWWARTVIYNDGAVTQKYAIALNNPHINHLRVYFNDSNTPAFETGDFRKFHERPVVDRDFIVPVEVASRDSVRVLMWLDKTGESLQVQAELFTMEELHTFRQNESLGMGLILGWMLFITLFGIFIYGSLRKLTYLYYTLYVISATMWMVAQWGIGFRYLWPNTDDFPSKARPIFMMLNALLLMVVLISFFPWKKRNKIWVKLIQLLCWVAGFLVVVTFFLSYKEFSPVFKLFLLNTGHFIIVAGILAAIIYLYNAYKDGYKLTLYYFVAIGLVLFSGLILNMIQYGLHLPMERFINTYSSSIGLLGETTLITFALSQRYNMYKKEKDRLVISLLEKEKEHAIKLVETEEQERKRIGRDLHDTLGGLLSAMKLNMEKLKHRQPELKPLLHPLEELNEQSISEMRSISHNLVPVNLGEQGLEQVLVHLIKRLNHESYVNFSLYFNVESSLSEAVAVHVYRICLELVNNAIKHSGAAEIVIQVVQENGSLLLIVEDTGKGFSPELQQEGIGLKNIHHRVAYLKGTLSIDSNSKGTTVIINLPLNN